MNVSAKEVQELRKISGAGMMECKSALSEANGDIDTAFKLLREKGVAKAEKKSSRDANEGLIGIKMEGNQAAIIEINTETDFVSRNSEFHKLMYNILDITLKNSEDSKKIKDDSAILINEAVGKIGENIVLKRHEVLKGNLYRYIHNGVDNSLGKIGVLLSLEPSDLKLDEVGKNLCMHIAASSPKAIKRAELDKDLLESEKDIINQQLKETGKPENILEKMLDGKLNKFFEEVILLEQNFVIDPTISVQEYIQEYSKKISKDISINNFIKFEIGS